MNALLLKLIKSVIILVPLFCGSIAIAQDVTIEYIAHASFRITSPEGTRIIIDPYASGVWLDYEYPENLEADALVITHPHYDHDGGQFQNRSLAWKVLPAQYREVGVYHLNDFTLIGVKGKHAGDFGKEFGQKNTIWVIEVGGIRIAHLGDNGPITDEISKAIGTVDILMFPADKDQHILKNHETLAYFEALRPKIHMPMHYCIEELQKDNKCPGGLMPIADPIVSSTKIIEFDKNIVKLSIDTIPEEPEYWVFPPSDLISRFE